MEVVLCLIAEELTRQTVHQALHSAGVTCQWASTNDLLPAVIREPGIAAFILDVQPDPENTRQLCQVIRKTSNAPILIVTSPQEDQLLTDLLEAGANDFVMKPAHPEELTLRLQVLLIRTSHSSHKPENQELAHEELVLDAKEHRVWKNKKEHFAL